MKMIFWLKCFLTGYCWVYSTALYSVQPSYLAILSIQNIKSDCDLGQAEQTFLHEVEELHVSSGLEEDVDTVISSMEEDKLTVYSHYCACYKEINSFCKKVLAKYFSDDVPEHQQKYSKQRLQSSLHSLGRAENLLFRIAILDISSMRK